jgi:hypothetical protein
VIVPGSADIPSRGTRRGSFSLTESFAKGTDMDDTDARKAVQESMDRRDQGASS